MTQSRKLDFEKWFCHFSYCCGNTAMQCGNSGQAVKQETRPIGDIFYVLFSTLRFGWKLFIHKLRISVRMIKMENVFIFTLFSRSIHISVSVGETRSKCKCRVEGQNWSGSSKETKVYDPCSKPNVCFSAEPAKPLHFAHWRNVSHATNRQTYTHTKGQYMHYLDI